MHEIKAPMRVLGCIVVVVLSCFEGRLFADDRSPVERFVEDFQRYIDNQNRIASGVMEAEGTCVVTGVFERPLESKLKRKYAFDYSAKRLRCDREDYRFWTKGHVRERAKRGYFSASEPCVPFLLTDRYSARVSSVQTPEGDKMDVVLLRSSVRTCGYDERDMVALPIRPIYCAMSPDPALDITDYDEWSLLENATFQYEDTGDGATLFTAEGSYATPFGGPVKLQYRLDASQGHMITRHSIEYGDPSMDKKGPLANAMSYACDIEWEERGGIWVPATIKKEGGTGPQGRYVEAWKLDWKQLNEPVPEGCFSILDFKLPSSTPINDQRRDQDKNDDLSKAEVVGELVHIQEKTE